MKKVVSKLKNISFAALFIILIGFSASKSQTVYDTLYLFPDTTTFLNESTFIGGWTDNFAIRFDVDSTWDDYLLEKVLFQVPSGIVPHLTTTLVISTGVFPEDSVVKEIQLLYDTIPLFPNISNLMLDTPVVVNTSNHFFISGFEFFMTLTLGPSGLTIPYQFQRFSGNGNWSEGLGSYFFLKVVVKKIVTNVEIEKQFLSTFSLSQNYPNPFNPSTIISYQLPVSGLVNLKVYDVLGNEVITLVNEEKPVGSHEIEFNATQLGSGVYFYRLQAGDFLETKKMIYLK